MTRFDEIITILRNKTLTANQILLSALSTNQVQMYFLEDDQRHWTD